MENINAPLYQALCEHQALHRSSFHTPGHKSAPGCFPPDFYRLDFTELPDTDSLFEADGPILRAEEETARLLGTKRTLFSAGGCTLCIQAMLRLAAPQGGKIIMGRVIHRSAIHTAALLDLQPVWVMPRPDEGEGLPGRIHAQDVKQALQENPDAKAVYLTSPDYYGGLADIRCIADVCAPYHVPVLVDNAHGAHLWWVGKDLHPLRQGAAMTACSAHKTLPVLTGGAWLHIGDNRFVEGAKEAMALFASTSPSYPIMASLDLCRAWLQEHGEKAFARLRQRVEDIRRVAARKGMAAPLGPCDPVRITLHAADIGLSGQRAAQLLRQSGVEPEYADGGYVVLIPTPFNSDEDFARLERAIAGLPVEAPLPGGKVLPLPPLPPKVMTPRQAVLAPGEEIDTQSAKGRVAAQAACPCPPGVPVVMPGEVITENCMEFLINYGIYRVKVVKC